MAIASAAHQNTTNAPLPSDSEIRGQLDRILASKFFDAKGRSRLFLEYIVEECLEGRSHLIKGYSIGLEVFGRTANFDAQNDPVVRIEAGKLRRSLERYFLLDGQRDRILITIPKGGYVPVFNWSPTGGRDADPGALEDLPNSPPWWRAKRLAVGICLAALLGGSGVVVRDVYRSFESKLEREAEADRQTIVVIPFEDITQSRHGTALAKGVTDEVVELLSKLPNLTVIVAQHNKPSVADGDVYSRGYRFEGRLRLQDRRARLSTRLLTSDGSVAWTSIDDVNLTTGDQIALQAKLALSILSRLASGSRIVKIEQ
ncbi:hypothetical protein [Mycoplana rhizolycopersici]|uniref:TolB-like protein n=1 Tax=Mycoplana rhizolycopersici TaxID=2746702 RepID=A0ABX2QQ73_9HYPH|nr:hypothetical protein [Rhizobium rhizolycopersici]NVP58713.1 hypothetical protein [Rhizobium rhizolycopersici]